MSVITDPWFYLAAIPAVILVGLAKGGFSGVGTVATPLLALTVSPVQAAAILLPILILQDAVSVWVFRHEWSRRVVASTLPGAVCGIVLAYAYAAHVSAAAVGLMVGLISVVFALRQLHRRTGPARRGTPSLWLGLLSGTGAGFTSQISHAGAPPFQMYVLPLGLSRNSFVGTSAIFFAAVNWLKVPAFVALGQFTHQTVSTSLALMPLAFAATWAGVWLVRRVPADRFFRIIYGLMMLVGVKLVWSGVKELLG